MPADIGPLATGDIDAWCAIMAEGQGRESGSSVDAGTLAAALRGGDASTENVLRLAARNGGLVVGAADCRVQPGGTFLRAYVTEPHRRAGLGRDLLDAAVRWSRGVGAARVTAVVVAGGPGEAFAANVGARTVIRLVTLERTLDRPAPAIPLPSGLRPVSWTAHCPDTLLPSYADLKNRVADAPDAHLQLDRPEWSPADVRAWEARYGRHLLVCGATDEDTGTLIGFTEVVAPDAGTVDQIDTAVDRAWRGRGLGTWLKATMVDRLRTERSGGDDLRLDRIVSTINERNAPMRTASERAGYRVAWRRRLVAIDLAQPESGATVR
jgi:GNAT superfamily N-acetyltransferase